ncbi:protein SICKLE-like [Phoenix dactylifera]|uniref:Protein SICKLE-like n=1 Tax=Phoenix dactylifera TaxID=42345 RepID=A0A8B7D2E4_PHODC|nr:protein SICKLE-like [Phoenix dactylifera]
MEDSAKRRGRFQAMRLEAEAASSFQSLDSSSSLPSSLHSPQLANPLLYPPPVAESSPPAPRFDYYTNPMSAFSGAQNRGGPGAYSSPTPPLSSPNVGQWNYHMRPAHPLHTTQSPGSTSYEMQSQFCQSTLWRSPVQYSAPYAGCQGTPVSGSSQFSQNTFWRSPLQYSAPYAGCQGTPVGGSSQFSPNTSRRSPLQYSAPDAGCQGTPVAGSSQFLPNTSWRSPIQYSAPYTGCPATPVSGSSVSSRSGGSSCYSYRPTPVSGGFSPHHGRGGSHLSNRGKRGSPHSNSGRGKGGRLSGNCSPRQTGGHGHGFHHDGSCQQDTGHYYRKSMVEDPWSELKPIVGDITKPRYWPLNSKKAKVIERGNEYQFSKTGGLAQFLAESFEEAVTET